MQIVIEIDDNEYLGIKNYPDNITSYPVTIHLYDAVRTGTPLPKGHGRILDEKDILDTENNNGGWYDLVDMPEYIAGVKPIIVADRAESEDTEDVAALSE